MKIQSVQFKHITHFTDLQLQLHPQQQPVALILGNQSSGKTSLLRFTYQALTWFAARYKDLRTSGLVMLDQDIMHTRLQSKIDLCVCFPKDIGSLPENSDAQQQDRQCCDWQLYKTLNSNGVGVSKAETQKLEKMVSLYQQAVKQDPLQGLPLIAYYPAERFVNEVNLLSKNNPLIFQAVHAYEISAIPFTTFTRFFEWFREISDIENAQSAQLIEQLLHPQHPDAEPPRRDKLMQAHAQMHAPSLQALRDALQIVLPELSQIYLQYHPKLQLMVTYQGKTQLYQQLSNSIRNWIALVGDIVRRLCLLNPYSLYPTLEGDGILLIDQVDHQLDQDMASVILARLHQAFPALQIIATGNRTALLENAEDYQCLRLDQQQLHPIHLQPVQEQLDAIYAQFMQTEASSSDESLSEAVQEPTSVDDLYQQIQQQLSAEQQEALLKRLQNDDDTSTPHPLP
ncbi:AAA family ATPase [Acinetobacter indicus]|uniref:AAA family ATPase n=1 Tax=Acinetobacter indicus TaxID=756892 RepID=UPI00148C6ADF|nr:AAA family ATPase [Acinetobacter indicus]NOJ68659.1 AAA family ATPase [Acinetobacter indicus]